MREKKPAAVFSFHTTAQAMAAEARLKELGLPGRLIPVPREITAGCGLAWKAPPEARQDIALALDGDGPGYQAVTELLLV